MSDLGNLYDNAPAVGHPQQPAQQAGFGFNAGNANNPNIRPINTMTTAASGRSGDPAYLTDYNPNPDRNKWYAQQTAARLHRSQWEDYKKRFQPMEEKLIRDTSGTQLLEDRLASISATADRAFSSALTGADLRKARYGISATGEQQAHEQNQMALGRAGAIADARNNTRTHIFDRNMETLGGGAAISHQAME